MQHVKDSKTNLTVHLILWKLSDLWILLRQSLSSMSGVHLIGNLAAAFPPTVRLCPRQSICVDCYLAKEMDWISTVCTLEKILEVVQRILSASHKRTQAATCDLPLWFRRRSLSFSCTVGVASITHWSLLLPGPPNCCVREKDGRLSN